MADSIITQKVGPLSGGVWILVIGAGLGIGFYLRRNAAPAAAPTVVSPSSGAGPGGWAATPVPDAVVAIAKPTTAALWAVGALAWLLTHNYDAALSDSAIRKYLGSQPLTTQEQAIINAVLTGYGPPPEILPPTGVDVSPIVPPPSDPVREGIINAYVTELGRRPAEAEILFWTAQTAIVGLPFVLTAIRNSPEGMKRRGEITNAPVVAPVSVPPPSTSVVQSPRTYTVQPGDNLSVIASRHYGWQDWTKIYNANRNQIRNPNLIHPGQVLVIPN